MASEFKPFPTVNQIVLLSEKSRVHYDELIALEHDRRVLSTLDDSDRNHTAPTITLVRIEH